MVFKILIFPKNNDTDNTKKKQKYFLFLDPTRIDLGPTYSHLKMRNQGYVVLEKIFKKAIWKMIDKTIRFFEGEPDKDWPCSYVFHMGESRIT